MVSDGVWAGLLAAARTDADACGELDWLVAGPRAGLSNPCEPSGLAGMRIAPIGDPACGLGRGPYPYIPQPVRGGGGSMSRWDYEFSDPYPTPFEGASQSYHYTATLSSAGTDSQSNTYNSHLFRGYGSDRAMERNAPDIEHITLVG